MSIVNIYIDSNNLKRSAERLGYEIDYKKFRGWLRQKYNPSHIYLFMGYIEKYSEYYKELNSIGYSLIFKPTTDFKNSIKGNCDAELVLKTTSDYYENNFDNSILISNDGDFGCLVEFLNSKKSFRLLLSPNKHKCSYLLRNKNVNITFLNEHYHKFSIIKKPPI